MSDEYTNLDAILQQWELVAIRVIALLGKDSFSAIYARSLLLTRLTFPWLPIGEYPSKPEDCFCSLRISLRERTVIEADSACKLAFTNFIAILAFLVGEHLTSKLFTAVLLDS